MARRPRIGIDAHILGKNAGGVERFVANLVRWLPGEMPECDFRIFVGKQISGRDDLPEATNLAYHTLASANPLIERSLVLPWLCRSHQLDILIVQRLAPWGCGETSLVTTVHDITPIKYPSAYRGLTNVLIRLLTGDTVRRSSRVLTPTRTIANEVATYFGLPSDRFVPFYNGVDTNQFYPGKTGGEPGYIFMSGAIEARKNLETLFCAKAKLGADLPWQIWIAGGVRDMAYRQSLSDLAEALGILADVRWLGFVGEAELGRLYREARVYVTASRDEGFNIPPLEAMASGVPVCCSDIPVHRELFEGAALFFATESADALAGALLDLARNPDLVTCLGEGARRCVERLSWPAMARRVACDLRELVEMN